MSSDKKMGFLKKAIMKQCSQMASTSSIDAIMEAETQDVLGIRSFTNISTQNANSNNMQNNNSNYAELITKNKKLTEELYIMKGEQKVLKDNSQTILKSKDDEIKLLKEKLFAVEQQSNKTIIQLKSDLLFKDASLRQAEMNKSMEKMDCSDDSLGSTKLIKHSPIVTSKKRNNFPSHLNGMEFSASKKLKNSTQINNNDTYNSKREETKMEVTQHVDSTLIVKEISKKVNIKKKIQEPKPLVVHIENPKLVIKSSNDLSSDFDFCLNIYEGNNGWDLISIPEIKHPQECCESISYDLMYGCSIRALQKLIPILRSCRNSHNELQSSDSVCMTEFIRLFSLQFQKLIISMRQRYGSVYTIMDEMLSRTRFNKVDILLKPQYTCLYHYIYPISEVISKMTLVAFYRPIIISEFLLNCLLPHLFQMVNYLRIKFCCDASNDYDKDNTWDFSRICPSFSNDFEDKFAGKIIKFIIQLVGQCSGIYQSNIFEKILQSFKKLLPMFAAKYDLKIIMLDLFSKMLKYDRFITWLSEHNDTCILYVIMNILDCECLFSFNEIEQTNLTNYMANIIYLLTISNFQWDSNCNCTDQIFLFVGHLMLNMARSVYEHEWTDTNKECLQNIVYACSQLKMSCGIENYNKFITCDYFLEFVSLFEYDMDYQHSLLSETEWPWDYIWFTAIVKDSMLLNKSLDD